MQAVVYGGPGIDDRAKITVEQRPIPELQHPRDVIVKVSATALCGSDLHLYRNIETAEPGFIMGHEFVGTVEAVGSAVSNLQKGDVVLSPFTISALFGSPGLDGGQAGWVRVPLGDTTLFKAPSDIPTDLLVLMGDIMPTGHHASSNARKLLPESEHEDAVVVVVGCGPVGICAITSASTWVKPGNLFAVDSVQERLDQAKRHGAIPLDLNGQGADSPAAIVKRKTDGRGADAVLEVVGLKPAYDTALSLIRPFGVISSVGVHNDPVLLSGPDTYDLNLRASFGRCPVRAEFAEALEILRSKKELFVGEGGRGFVSHVMDLEDAPEAYKLFDRRQVRKVVFRPKHK